MEEIFTFHKLEEARNQLSNTKDIFELRFPTESRLYIAMRCGTAAFPAPQSLVARSSWYSKQHFRHIFFHYFLCGK